MIEIIVGIVFLAWCSYLQLWIYHLREHIQEQSRTLGAIADWIDKAEAKDDA